MRHLKRGRKLGRNATHRKAMFRNMANSFFEHEEIVTTVAKAKELRPFVEKMITIARKGALANHDAEKARGKLQGLDKNSPDRPALLGQWRQAAAPVLHARRRLIVYLGNHRLQGDSPQTVIEKLLTVIGPRFADRPGGYTRIAKLAKRRLGDAGHTALIALVGENEVKPQRKREQKSETPESPKPSETEAEKE